MVFAGFLFGTSGSEKAGDSRLWAPLSTTWVITAGPCGERVVAWEGVKGQRGQSPVLRLVQLLCWFWKPLGLRGPHRLVWLLSVGHIAPFLRSDFQTHSQKHLFHSSCLPSRIFALKPCCLLSSLRCSLLPRMGHTIMSGQQRGARRPSKQPSPPW